MKKKKLFSLVLVFAIMVTMIVPAGTPAYAASNPATRTFDISEGDITVTSGGGNNIHVTYGGGFTTDFANTQELTIVGATTTNKVVVDGVTAAVCLDNTSIQPATGCAFALKNGADVTLSLVGGNTLKTTQNSNAGLRLSAGETLTIKGPGSLDVSSNANAAGIGQSYNDGPTGGTVNILSGTVVAMSGQSGAGIGGTNGGSGGTINIYGGTVTATGHTGGAGIGGGIGAHGGTINIYGGTVIATGSPDITGAAGIGGGGNGGNGGSISIYGGNVTATGGNRGAGIGGGHKGGNGGSISITGGNIIAKGSNGGAGIGGGAYEDGTHTGGAGTIVIENCTVTAEGGKWTAYAYGGAAIGSGCSYTGTTAASGSVTIMADATVKAASYGTAPAAVQALTPGSTARVLQANFAAVKNSNTNTDIYVEYPSALYTSFTPEQMYQSIAFTVPSDNTYRLITAGTLQQHNAGPTTSFPVTSGGMHAFFGVTDIPPASSPLNAFTQISLTQTGDVAHGNVQYADADAVIAALPGQIAVTLVNGLIVNVPVSWDDSDNYDAGEAGDYTFAATWGAMPGGANNDNGLAAPTVEVTVTAGELTTSPLESFIPLTLTQTGDVAHNNVQYATADAVIEALPDTVAVTLESGAAVDVPVTWADTDNYNAGVAAAYTFTGTWGTMPAGANNDNGLTAPTVEVVVNANTYWSSEGNYDTILYSRLIASDFDDTTVYISTPQQLAAVARAQDVNGVDLTGVTIELTEDIDLDGCLWNPIGLANGDTLHGTADGYQHQFLGNFEGNNHLISNMTVTGQYIGAGLFGTVGDPDASEPITIRNVIVNGTVNVTDTMYAGGIIGCGFNLYLNNCVNNAEITCTSSDQAFAGGILGSGFKSIMEGCVNKAAVNLTAASAPNVPLPAGGLAGMIYLGSIYNSANLASVTCSDSVPEGALAGGIAGYSIVGTINNCYNTGAVTAFAAGGICGVEMYTEVLDTEDNDVLLRNCYNAGLITAQLAGGIAGMNNAGMDSCYYLDSTASCAYYDSPVTTVNGSRLSADQIQSAGFCGTLNSWVAAHAVSGSTVESTFHLAGVSFKGWVRQEGVNGGCPMFGDDHAAPSAACDVVTWIIPAAPAIDNLQITKTVSNSATVLAVNVTVSTGASWKLYNDPGCTGEIPDKAMHLSIGENTAYLKVTAQDGISSKKYILTITRQAAAQHEDDGGINNGGGTASPPISSGVDILVNDKKVNAGTASNSTEDGKTVTTITVDQQKLDQKLAAEGDNALVIIPVNSNADKVIGQLNGQMIRTMEEKQATLEVRTESASYTLPASEINLTAVSEQLGTNVGLADITVQVSIAVLSGQTASVVESAAEGGGFSAVVPAVDFNISCTFGGKTVVVSAFNAYVKRTVAIPGGIDPMKITTGIVVNPDGTVHHVPTKVTVIDGKYYAVINSLTNSTYTVIWHPVEFKDVANHWAKEAVNDMGSRMVITGVGNNTYKPDRSITRAEFAAIVVRALGLAPGTGMTSFSDVEVSEWYCGYIETASAYGIIQGYGEGTFRPNDRITREQAMVMIARAMKITGLKSEIKDREISLLFTNYSVGAAASDYAKASIAACLKSGIITGRSSNTIAPKNYITRAEVAVIVKRLLQKSNLI